MACCGSFTYKCSATFIGIILCIEFLILLIELYLIATNDYFELMFSAFYALFLIPILVSVVVFLIWLCDTSDIEFRKWLPGALWVAVVGNFVLIGWIIIYLLAIYDNENEYVIVQKYLASSDKMSEADPEQKDHNKELKEQGYSRQYKEVYIFIHCVVPALFGSFALIYWFIIRKWASHTPIEDDEEEEEEGMDKDKKDDKKKE